MCWSFFYIKKKYSSVVKCGDCCRAQVSYRSELYLWFSIASEMLLLPSLLNRHFECPLCFVAVSWHCCYPPFFPSLLSICRRHQTAFPPTHCLSSSFYDQTSFLSCCHYHHSLGSSDLEGKKTDTVSNSPRHETTRHREIVQYRLRGGVVLSDSVFMVQTH